MWKRIIKLNENKILGCVKGAWQELMTVNDSDNRIFGCAKASDKEADVIPRSAGRESSIPEFLRIGWDPKM